MNIFFLDLDPFRAARWHVDDHVTKMPLEHAQLVVAVHHRLDTSCESRYVYSPTHLNHPCVDWLLDSRANLEWLLDCSEELGRVNPHASARLVPLMRRETTELLPDRRLSAPPLCMPREYRLLTGSALNNAVASYRHYYRLGKAHLHSWTYRSNLKPEWIQS